jgi:putative membrane protein
VTTLVVCLDRTDDVGRKTGLRSPVVGWEAVRALVTDVGLADPEDSGVNSLLETLRVAQSLRDENEEVVVAVVSGDRESMVSADRSVARQIDDLMAAHDPESAVVVIDSAEDERLVPIVESRVQVDSVDRVVVRQARDIESTYYLLKQFLADEELRQTVLVPIGLTLLVFPMLAWFVGPAEGAAAITTVIGLFLLYKGFNIDEIMTGFAHQARESLYSGQVSVVTYVVAAGLTLVGLFVGALGVSNLDDPSGVLLPAVRFAFDSVPWLAAAALTASAGRLLDEVIREEPIRSSYLNLPFIVVSVGLVIRGFSAYFLEQQRVIDSLQVPAIEQGVLSIDSFAIAAGERLALYVVGAIVVSLVGAWIAASFSGANGETSDERPRSEAEPESGLTDGGPRSALPPGAGFESDSDADDAETESTASDTCDESEPSG